MAWVLIHQASAPCPFMFVGGWHKTGLVPSDELSWCNVGISFNLFSLNKRKKGCDLKTEMLQEPLPFLTLSCVEDRYIQYSIWNRKMPHFWVTFMSQAQTIVRIVCCLAFFTSTQYKISQSLVIKKKPVSGIYVGTYEHFHRKYVQRNIFARQDCWSSPIIPN